MTWVDLSAVFAYGSKLTSAQMQNLRDNVVSVAQDLAYFCDPTEYGSTPASFTTVITFPFRCPERPSELRLVAMLKAAAALTYVRGRVGMNGSYSATYGEVIGTTYTARDCGIVDISGLTPGTVYEGEVQILNETGTGTAYIKNSIITVSS